MSHLLYCAFHNLLILLSVDHFLSVVRPQGKFHFINNLLNVTKPRNTLEYKDRPLVEGEATLWTLDFRPYAKMAAANLAYILGGH